MKNKRVGTILLWTVQGAVALLFLAQALPKLMGAEMVVENFARWGFPPGFHLLIGGLELAGAIGLLLPRFSPYAASGLIAVMFGAVWTHLSRSEPGVMMPLAVLVLLGIVAWARRPAFLRPSAAVVIEGARA